MRKIFLTPRCQQILFSRSLSAMIIMHFMEWSRLWYWYDTFGSFQCHSSRKFKIHIFFCCCLQICYVNCHVLFFRNINNQKREIHSFYFLFLMTVLPCAYTGENLVLHRQKQFVYSWNTCFTANCNLTQIEPQTLNWMFRTLFSFIWTSMDTNFALHFSLRNRLANKPQVSKNAPPKWYYRDES